LFFGGVAEKKGVRAQKLTCTEPERWKKDYHINIMQRRRTCPINKDKKKFLFNWGTKGKA